MRALVLTLLAALVAASALQAQDGYPRRFRFDVGLGAGAARHETESSPIDGDTAGGLARLRFEGVSRHGIGGGLRLESWGSDDDLFVDEGFAAEEASASAFYGHFTYRLDRGRFLMPVRMGLLIHNYELENVASGSTTLEVDSVGFRFEVAPEVVFNRGSVVEVSGYGEFSLGAGYSSVEVSTFTNDFDSSSAFWGFELGARVRYEFAELGLAFATTGMVMAESDTFGGNFVRGFGADFTGILFTAAFVF